MAKGHLPESPQESFNPNYNPFYATHEHEKHHEYSESTRMDFANFFGSKTIVDTKPQIAFEENPFEPQDKTLSATTTSATTTPINYLNQYIITTLKSGMVVIDQQRAHERILYEKLLSRTNEGPTSAQQLLFPVNCRFNASDSEVLSELIPDLERLGFVISPLGQNTFVVSAAPHDTKEDELQNILEQTINEYKNNMMQKFNDRNKSICLCLARQMAVHSGTALKVEEMQKLIADLFSCQAPDISPSGKRTMFIMGEQELKERFK